MEIGNHDFGPLQIGKHITGNQLAACIIAVRIVRLKHAKPIFDGQAGGDHQESPCKSPAGGPPHCVDGLPGNQHGHDRCFSCAGGEFQSQAQQFRVGVVISIDKVFQKDFSGLACIGSDFRQPDNRLDRFHLAEERPNVVEPVMPPVLKQSGGFGRYLPVIRARQASPLIYMSAQFIDDGRWIVLLFLGGKSFAFVEDQVLLLGCAFALLGFWNGCDVFGAATFFDDLLCRLTLRVEFPVPFRVIVWRIDDRPLEESIIHANLSFRYNSFEFELMSRWSFAIFLRLFS